MPRNHDERRPLLPNAASEEDVLSPERQEAIGKRQDTLLPMGQLTILALIRLAEPISFTLIFPFVNQMMQDLKVTDKPSEIGFYSGLVDSSFAIAQCFTILQWGRLSDRFGRRPIIFIGLLGPVVSVFLFGISQNLAWALVSRSVAGATSGNVAVIQSILAEITDSTNEAKAMPLTAIFWSVGCIIGPLIGGSLAHPAERWPSSILNNAFFRKYPYAFPCSIGAGLGLVAFIFAYFFLNETLNRTKFTEDENNATTTDFTSNPASSSVAAPALESNQPPPKATTIHDIISHPPLWLVILSGFMISALTTAYDVVFALMCFTPIYLGGLSMTTAQIGYALSFGGIFSIVILPTGLPILQRRFGTANLYNILSYLWPLIYLSFPLLNLLARHVELQAAFASMLDNIWLLWLSVGALVILSRIANMLFSLNTMLVKAAAPDKKMLGTTYGVTLTTACMARAIFPAFVGSLFAISVDRQLIYGNLVWLVMAAIGGLGVLASARLKRLEA